MGLLIVAITCLHLDTFLSENQIYDFKLNWLYLPLSYILSLGPSIYLYIRCLLKPSSGANKKDLIHYIPVFLMTLIYILIFIFVEGNRHTIAHSKEFLFISLLDQGLAILSGIIYLGYSITLLVKHDVLTREQFSSLKNHNLNLLKILIIGFLAYFQACQVLKN